MSTVPIPQGATIADAPASVPIPQNASLEPTVKMLSREGVATDIGQSRVEAAKQSGFVLHPDEMKPPQPTKKDDTSLNGKLGTGALPKGFKGDPGSSGQLATDEEVNARAAATNANLSPEQKKALGISDSLQGTAGQGMTVGAAAGGAALVAGPAGITWAAKHLLSKEGLIAGGVLAKIMGWWK
jgi:hypothetical protein